MNLAIFLSDNHACERLVCGTCGGLILFDQALKRYFAGGKLLFVELVALPDVADNRLVGKGHLVQHLIRRLPSEDEKRALASTWDEKTRDNPIFASLLLDWLSDDSDLLSLLLHSILEALIPRAIEDRDFRHELHRRFPGESSAIPALEQAFESDDESDRVAWEAAELLQTARQAARTQFLNELSQLKPGDRFRRLVQEPDLRPRTLPAEWAVVSSADLQDLTYSEAEALIQYVGWKSIEAWASTLQCLFHLRHNKRKIQIERLRRSADGKSTVETLEFLLQDFSVPIELYPPELAELVTLNTMEQLPTELRARFESLLRNTRLRCWRKLAMRLRGY